ncbi:23S rRNA (adenine(2030)-N(6))-methyltransferase RlmJ [Aquibium oceanicum]|uniref:Ribosomal RNA large subunit methyltransferase J n=1 Tax=Aquibium oceanicum TaxID=1670800 RepID=A0A1L3SQV0_9HYPH|nr:23S rRNA (adenine(2030)-N(6))-methyltransferase RlmJ [Aquibium oceanicum]APH71807.1 23S rRNA (adenine(2030)-N(6))-methyltransferase RlmJ [Aquibium oceanicum]
MNYRHAYHAGNFADVFKHAVLGRIVEYLKHKDKTFRVIDTHAGTGLYDLSSDEAQKTGEWRGGIGRLMDASLPRQASDLLAPYLDAVRALNPDGGVRHYPGSPTLVRHLLRSRDRLTAVELHPDDASRLKARFAGDFQVRVIQLDGWLALGAQLPPKEKRGLVLIDPPFEETGEFDRIAERLGRAHRRWPGGIYAVWYPIKDGGAVNAFHDALRGAKIPKITDFSILVRKPSSEPRLDGCGMLVVNPPFTLEEEMRTIMPALSARLGERGAGNWQIEEIAGEAPPSDDA